MKRVYGNYVRVFEIACTYYRRPTSVHAGRLHIFLRAGLEIHFL